MTGELGRSKSGLLSWQCTEMIILPNYLLRLSILQGQAHRDSDHLEMSSNSTIQMQFATTSHSRVIGAWQSIACE